MNDLDNNGQWLDNLLSQPAGVIEGDFTRRVMHGVRQGKRRRYLILGGALLLSALLTLLLAPWRTLFTAIQNLFSGFVLSVDTNALTPGSELRWHYSELVQWASQSQTVPLLLVGLLSVVCLLQWLLQDN